MAGIEALNKRTDTNYIREEFQRRRDLIYDGINAIDGLACRPVPATFYAFVDIGRTELVRKILSIGCWIAGELPLSMVPHMGGAVMIGISGLPSLWKKKN